MENLNKKTKIATATAILAILLFTSTLVLLNMNTASSQSTTTLSDADLLADDKYGWPVGPGYDSGNTFFNPGPGPNRADILWQTRVPGTQAAISGAPVVAMDGKIFAWGGGRLWAFDPITGRNLSDAPMRSTPRGFGTATLFKIADGYLAYEYSTGIAVHSTKDCQEVAYVERNITLYGSHGGGSVVYWGGFYSSWDKKKYTTALSNVSGWTASPTPVHLAVAYDLSEPTQPKFAWAWAAPTGIETLGSAPGLAIFGGYGEGEIYALNATTGELVWKQWKAGNAGYMSNYYDGKIYHSASSISLTCYNATTGEIIFNRAEGPRAYFVFGDAIAYGRYLGKNIDVPYGFVGAWDINTGEPLWKTRALYNIAYLTPCVADGKLYVQRFSGTAAGVAAETNKFACFDVYTGAVLWELPGFTEGTGMTANTPIIAYGRLYIITGGTLYCLGDSKEPFPNFHAGYNYTMPGVQYGRTGPLDLTKPAWTYNASAAISGSAVAGNDRVYFGTLGGEVHCVDHRTGTMLWKFKLGYRMASTPALVGDRLYIGPDDGNIYCLNATSGAEIWKFPVDSTSRGPLLVPAWQIRASPIVVDNRLYVSGLDGKFYCINALTGVKVWDAAFDRGAERPGVATALVLKDNNTVVVSCTDSALYAFFMNNGTRRWKQVVQPTTGFDDRAMASTPVYDRGTLWMVVDTWMLARFNLTTGEFIGQYRLPYSGRTGTMTPAITTPAIWTWPNGSKTLFVGDGFQFVAFDITTIRLNASLFMNETQTPSGAGLRFGRVYFRGPPITLVNATTSNTVADNQGNETYLPLVWERWMGHQVYSSPIVSATLRGVRVYFGDDVNSITVVNATGLTFNVTGGGAPLSVYTTLGPVFASACLYDGYLYIGSQDCIMYAFKESCVQDFTIHAAASKTVEMWNNETIVIRGRLQPTVRIDATTGLGSYEANGLPGATVKLSVTKPDGSDVSLTTTTDDRGYFEFTYSPTEVGDYGWVAYYEGEEKPWITYLPAYGEWHPIKVTKPWTPSAPEPTPPGSPMEYVYVAVAVIVIVLVALGAYVLIKRKK